MKQLVIMAILLAVLAFSNKVCAGQSMPDRVFPATENLVLNGLGERTKFFLSLYDAGLYLQAKDTDPESIIAADRPMAIRLVIRSSFITSEKMEKATREGFAKSTGGKTTDLEKEIREFISVFREVIKKDDIYLMVYLPETGVKVMKNNRLAAIIPGLAFKKALFGIWLGSDPVQASLKKELLDGR